MDWDIGAFIERYLPPDMGAFTRISIKRRASDTWEFRVCPTHLSPDDNGYFEFFFFILLLPPDAGSQQLILVTHSPVKLHAAAEAWLEKKIEEQEESDSVALAILRNEDSTIDLLSSMTIQIDEVELTSLQAEPPNLDTVTLFTNMFFRQFVRLYKSWGEGNSLGYQYRKLQ